MATDSFRDLLARARRPLPEPTWTDSDDLARLSIEAMVTEQEGDARSIRSVGDLRLHGAGVAGHRADLDAVGQISTSWQRAVTAIGAAIEGVRTARGRIPAEITNRTRLELTASPGPGSLVLQVQPAANPLEEAEPGGDRAMVDPPRPLADRASATLIDFSDRLAGASIADLEALSSQFADFGPRVAGSLRTLANTLTTTGISLDAAWREPGVPTRRASWDPDSARWIRDFIDGHDLDSEDVEIAGIAETISNRERWLLVTPLGDMRVTATSLPPGDVRRVRAGDSVRLLVRATTRQQPDGSTRTMRKALRLVSVEPPETNEG